eukprot:10447166-Alexandrium_andersonii.AAC.1
MPALPTQEAGGSRNGHSADSGKGVQFMVAVERHDNTSLESLDMVGASCHEGLTPILLIVVAQHYAHHVFRRVAERHTQK